MSAILVTGGAGFIGAALCRRLLAAGRRVVLLDRVPDTRQERALSTIEATATATGGGLEIVRDDLRTMAAPALRRALVGVSGVVHLAGQPGVQSSWAAGFDAHLRDNLAAGQRLLEALLDAPVDRVVVASSSSVYGEGVQGPAAEGAPLRPASPYGVAKAALEMLVGTYAARGVPAVALRYFSVYGRGQRPDMAVARMVAALDGGPAFPLRGDGRQVRDMTHVDDVIAATVAALDAPLRPGTILNVGSGRPVSLLEVLEEVGRLAGRTVPRRWSEPAPGDPARTHADIAAARAALGWEPRVPLAQGLADQLEGALATTPCPAALA